MFILRGPAVHSVPSYSIVELNKINKFYNKGFINEFHALNNVNFHIDESELIAIIGPSGSGKTTLLNIIGFVDSFNSGEYFLNGINVSNISDKKRALLRNSTFGYVMQDYSLIPMMSIFDNVAIPLYIANIPYKQIKSKVWKAIQTVNLHDISDKKITELSGGQKQRVAIARAIVNDPKIVLADEPTGALDKNNGNNIIMELINISKLGKSVIIVTHDTSIASQCNRIINIEDGVVQKYNIN